MKTLQQLLVQLKPLQIAGSLELSIGAIEIDSRKVKGGTAFIAITGVQTDGHTFIHKAIELGAVAIICETMPAELVAGITYVKVANTQEATARMAVEFYNHPSTQVKLVGVTGTNGKTTIATLLFKLFRQLGYKCGLISTVQNQIDDAVIPATHTTPDAINLNALLQQMVNDGCSYVFMECSSHAIHQHRITGLQFDGALFSNITHDHLDYHKTFDEYIRVKKKFFDDLPATAFAISNADDKRGEVMLQNTVATKYLYSLKTMAAFKGKILENALTGLVMTINDQEVHFRLIGTF
ncbi:MAG: UDP-N-acetylmuramoyl-L-alanyl-D-glutamate--2,6-diaminopimelate ligase, partial [Sediminibacterium sp.]|nr:UDP-N-acetylmuramoyl-L-alanyl-D-glutamate--2,6-diaminopimelate ligase [Sediminibacterium sp.]